MENTEERALMRRRRLKQREVAQRIGIDPATLSRWLRYPLNEKQRKRVVDAINSFETA